jgi:23S rRNA pseudouridine1911/1915/1917 synthase
MTNDFEEEDVMIGEDGGAVELGEGAPEPVITMREPVDMVVRVKAEGMRLDHYLSIFFQDFSRTVFQEVIKEGRITINGKPTKPSYRVRSEDKLHVEFPVPTHELPQPEDIPLDILYEDEWLVLVNKPSNMVVHPAKGNWSGTLVNALQFRFQNQLSNVNGNLRPGIVHRLDKDTTGVILIAKDEITHRDCGNQFESRKVFKEYIALSAGELDRDSDYIEGAMKLHPHDRLRMIVSTDEDAKHALSYYEVMERFKGFTLVKVQPRTGRTHQIRVHLQHVGCPVIADKLYANRQNFKLSEAVPILMARQALHAFRLRFKHPRKSTWLEVEAPLPNDMRKTLNALREHRKFR